MRKVNRILAVNRGGLGAIVCHCVLHSGRVLVLVPRLVLCYLVLNESIGVEFER